MQPAQTGESVETAGVETAYFVEGQIEKDEVPEMAEGVCRDLFDLVAL